MSITLANIGPITTLTIPVPDKGGLVVLRARNGKGKTKALDAIESAVSGNGKVEVRDGQLRGEVDAFGVTMTVGRSTRRKGELEVSSLSGRFNIEHLVDPKIKSPEAADAVRIKALIQIAGIQPDASHFHGLLGGREAFEQLVGASAVEASDPVTMADRIKRDLEAAARRSESQAEHAEGRALGAKVSASAVDVTQPSDSQALQDDLEDAIRSCASLATRARAATEWRRRVQAARDALEDAEASYTGPTLDAAVHEAMEATGEVQRTGLAVIAAEKALDKARQEAKSADARMRHAQKMRDAANQHAEMVRSWRETLASPQATPVPDGQLRQAEDRVSSCRAAVEHGVLIRKAMQSIEEAEKATQQASEHRKRADTLREAAKATDEVLSGLVAQSGVPVRVEAGRLVLDTVRGATYFADLSQGERRKFAIDAGIRHVGERGVIVICQEAFESLDPIARQELADHLVNRGVIGLTAECSADEEITAEVV